MAPKKAKLNLARKVVHFSVTPVASDSLKIKPKPLVWLERPTSLAIFLFCSTPSFFPLQYLYTCHPGAYQQCSFCFYIAHSFFRSQLKLHILSYVFWSIYSITILLPNFWYLLSHHPVYLLYNLFCLFMCCLPPLEWHSLTLTSSNSFLSPWCLDQGPPCRDTQSLFVEC